MIFHTSYVTRNLNKIRSFNIIVFIANIRSRKFNSSFSVQLPNLNFVKCSSGGKVKAAIKMRLYFIKLIPIRYYDTLPLNLRCVLSNIVFSIRVSTTNTFFLDSRENHENSPCRSE